MEKRDSIYLKHILDNIENIESSLEGLSEEDFQEDLDKVDATIRRVEIMGEAVKNISDELKDAHPEIEWKKIAGTRDILVHSYFRVDKDLLWEIIEKDLPLLKDKIVSILKEGKYE